MTKISNDPSEFAHDATAGFLRLYPHLVEGVTGGAVRSSETPEGKVAVVIGGGSGHYPAFAGWIGPGMADGAVIGDVFASPSTQQVYNVAKAAHTGGGVFLSYGNYAGDVLNFDLAAERLRAEGIATQSLPVTDDVTSASLSERSKRRGTAGGLVVFKIAGAAAEAGYSLDAVTEIARRANDATVSFAVAFAGCTLPGAMEPLFTVPAGQMGVGMGVHGEPGISDADIPSAAELATLLVDKLLEERPDGATKVIALVNGLGGTKYEELFVLWNDIAARLEVAELTPVAPEVGELITSLDMAGVSLTLTWLDDELEQLWLAPTETAGFRRGVAAQGTPRQHRAQVAVEDASWPEASEASQTAAAGLLEVANAVQAMLNENEQRLGDLDAFAGDGDHGRGMAAGVNAAVKAMAAAVSQGAGLASALGAAGDAWADRAGGTSGALWGTGLRAASRSLSDTQAPAAADVHAAVSGALEHLVGFGKAQRGDKTMLDALIPFVEALGAGLDGGASLVDAWNQAAARATTEAEATASLSPRVGRSRPLAEKSIGHPDPGAISLALVVTTAGQASTDQTSPVA